MDGVLIINKPQGITSFKVIEKLRTHFKVKKMGHAGTLDPQATGVLVVCIGKATKLASHFMNQEKEYEGTIKLGEETTTDDSEGEITAQHPVHGIERSDVEKILKTFVGTISQKPPYFSAVKKNGRRLYDYARAGQFIDVAERLVTISQCNILQFNSPYVKVHIVCSKGTYVRAIARDLGKALSVGAHLSELCRTGSGQFHISKAHSLSEILAEPCSSKLTEQISFHTVSTEIA